MSDRTISGGQKSVQLKLGNYLSGKVDSYPTSYTGQITAPNLPGYGQMSNALSGYDPSQLNQLSNQGMMNALNAMNGQPTPDGGQAPAAPQIGMDPVTNYWQQSTLNPMMRQFNTVIKPQIRAAFAGQSGFSSREGNTMANAYGNTMQNAQSQLGQMQNQALNTNAQMQQSQMSQQNTRDIAGAQMGLSAYGNQLGNMQSYTQQGMQNALQSTQQGGMLAQALNPLQSQANLGAQNQYQEFIRTQRENSPYLQQALQFMGQRTQQPTQASNPWGTVAGAVLPIAAGLASNYMGGNGRSPTSGFDAYGRPTSNFGSGGTIF